MITVKFVDEKTGSLVGYARVEKVEYAHPPPGARAEVTDDLSYAPESMVQPDWRAVRDALLKQTDWTQVEDAPISPETREKWRLYRQALRDLPSHPDWPQVEWPQPPEVKTPKQSQ